MSYIVVKKDAGFDKHAKEGKIHLVKYNPNITSLLLECTAMNSDVISLIFDYTKIEYSVMHAHKPKSCIGASCRVMLEKQIYYRIQFDNIFCVICNISDNIMLGGKFFADTYVFEKANEHANLSIFQYNAMFKEYAKKYEESSIQNHIHLSKNEFTGTSSMIPFFNYYMHKYYGKNIPYIENCEDTNTYEYQVEFNKKYQVYIVKNYMSYDHRYSMLEYTIIDVVNHKMLKEMIVSTKILLRLFRDN